MRAGAGMCEWGHEWGVRALPLLTSSQAVLAWPIDSWPARRPVTLGGSWRKKPLVWRPLVKTSSEDLV